MSGCCAQSHCAPYSAPASSSPVNTSISSPASGRQPSSASASAAATSAATWLFMSIAPRPQTQPSRSSPRPRVDLQSAGSASTVSTWPSRHSVGPSDAAAQARDQVRAPWHGGEQLALEAGRLEQPAQEVLRRRLVARRVDGVEADQPLEQLGGARARGRRARARSECMAGSVLAAGNIRARAPQPAQVAARAQAPRARQLQRVLAARATGRPSPRAGLERDRRRSARPGAACVSPLATTRCQGSASAKSHWIVPGSPGAWRSSRLPRHRSGTAPPSSRGRGSAAPSSRRARRPARAAGPARARSARLRSAAKIGGPGSSSIGMPALRSLVSSEAAPSLADLLEREAEALGVAHGPSRRHEHGGGPGDHLAQQVGHRVPALGVLAARGRRAA